MSKSIKILCQGFYPDIVAAGELMYELAERLVNKHGLDVSVITAQPSFTRTDNLPDEEVLNGIKVKRFNIFNFNKNSIIGKILNSWSFFIQTIVYVLFEAKNDLLLIPTCPPLLPLVGTIAKFLYGQKYIYLMHDVYPEIASKLGYIKQNGLIYKIWNYLTVLALKNADQIIVLSDDMKLKLLDWVNDLNYDKIQIIHNWSNEDLIKVITKENNHLLDKYNLRNRFIVEYSGNLGRIHEFKTILNAAIELKNNEEIVFLFIGDGGKKQEIVSFIKDNNLLNVVLLPYQERSELSYSLGMADIHLLSLDEGYENLAVPSKFYGILAAGKPVAFISNSDCHISKTILNNKCGFNIKIGDYNTLANIISYYQNNQNELELYTKNTRIAFENNFTLDKASNLYFKCIEETVSEKIYPVSGELLLNNAG